MTNKKDSDNFFITVPSDVAAALRALARQGFRSVSQEVARLVSEEMLRQRKAANALPTVAEVTSGKEN